MTSKEALEKIKYIDIDGRYPYPNFLKDDEKYSESICVLEKLVKRDTPMKVIKVNENKNKILIGGKCPMCNTIIFATEYCSHCGQRLDWSVEK